MSDVATLPEVASDGFAAMRRAARAHFLERGWPNRRIEAYKYTDLSALARQDWRRPARAGETGEMAAPLGVRFAWVDGYASAPPPFAWLRPLRDCARSPSSALTDLLGRLAPEDDPVVALNTALFDHGAWIALPAGVNATEPLELVHALGTQGFPAGVHARLTLSLGEASHLTLIERFIGEPDETLFTRVAEIALAENAELLHIRLNEAGTGARLLGCTAVRLSERARYRCFTFDLGGALAREAFRIDLAGEAAATELAGIALLDGRRHADSDVLVTHNAPHTRSRQRFRGVLDGRSRGVYSGKVLVSPGAQKSDSAQESANLLLSPKAEADTRPQLEIYADDVACSHGAATGAIDPEALFYLQSRGLGADAARRMIAYGFAARTLDELDDGALRKALATLLAERMQAPPEVREWL